MKLRLRFEKHGAVRYIGHLDVMRYFQKTIRRAEIDVAYTKGFSPHQIMTFAAPLGVGIESNGEYMDIEVHSMTTCEDIKNRINAASVPGIQIRSVRILPDTAENAMASVAAAEYTVSFKEGRAPSVDIAGAVEAFLQKKSVIITKATKKGTRDFDLRPGVYVLEWNGQNLHMLLNASSGNNIKPVQVMEAMLAEYGESLPENALFITREDVYTRAESEPDNLISLGDIGHHE